MEEKIEILILSLQIQVFYEQIPFLKFTYTERSRLGVYFANYTVLKSYSREFSINDFKSVVFTTASRIKNLFFWSRLRKTVFRSEKLRFMTFYLLLLLHRYRYRNVYLFV